MNKPSTRARLVLLLAGIVFLGLLVGYILLMRSVGAAWQQAYDARHAALSLRAEEDQSFQIEKTVRENKENIAKIDSYFLTEAAVPQFIERLETIADILHTPIHLSSLTTDTHERTSSLLVSLVATGEFAHVSGFIRAIELLPYRTTVESVSFSQEVGAPTDTQGALATPEQPQKKKPVATTPRWTAAITFRILSFREKSQGKPDAL